MNIWHLHARYYNFGDYALGVGLRNLFSRHFSDRIIFKTFDCHETRFDHGLIDHLNDTADLMLVGGGGLIHEFGGEWLFHLPSKMIARLRTPTIFYGLGYNTFRGQADISTPVINNIRQLQARSLSFSVRNDGSRERLERLGIVAPEVPDPGFFVSTECIRPPLDGRYVAVQLAADMLHYRNYQEDALLAGMQEVVADLLKRGYQVVLTPHVRSDIGLSNLLMSRMGHPYGLSIWNLFEMLRDEYTLVGLSYYKHAKFVVAMRGHSQICPMAMGTPVITVANHDKHLGLLAKLGVSPLLVDANDKRLGVRLLELTQEVECRHEQIVAEYGRAIDDMTRHAERFIREVKSRFDQSRAIAGGQTRSLPHGLVKRGRQKLGRLLARTLYIWHRRQG